MAWFPIARPLIKMSYANLPASMAKPRADNGYSQIECYGILPTDKLCYQSLSVAELSLSFRKTPVCIGRLE
jgi:hypothetical protein